MDQNTSSSSFLPERFQILSGSALKVIAMVVMFIDHVAAFLLIKFAWATQTLFTLGDTSYSIYRICRDIGRIAFPIFCFLLVEGFLHTRDRKKYGRNLLIFALISEIPWNLVHAGTVFYTVRQNVFFTLFLGYLGMCVIEYFWEKQTFQFLGLLALLGVSCVLHADYNWRGFIFILIMYWFRNYRASQAIIGSCWLYYEWKACFSYLFINMYNGERGFIKSKAGKYFFYAFYPVHIFIIYLVRYYFFKI